VLVEQLQRPKAKPPPHSFGRFEFSGESSPFPRRELSDRHKLGVIEQYQNQILTRSLDR
jgi:hypothetical protein